MKRITRKQGESNADYMVRLRKEYADGAPQRTLEVKQKKDRARRKMEKRIERKRQRAQRVETLTTLRQMFPLKRAIRSCLRCGAQLVPLGEGGERYCPSCQEIA
jgi:hypothetical protein